MIKLLGLEKKVKITPVSSTHFKKEYFAERPPNERLVNKKLGLREMNIMRNWKVALKEYLGEYYSNYLD